MGLRLVGFVLFVFISSLSASHNVLLEHTVGQRDDGSFIWAKRGTITHGNQWQMMSAASSSTPPSPLLSTTLVQLPYNVQAKQSKSKDPSAKLIPVSIEQESLSAQDAAGIASMLDNGEFYSVRVSQPDGGVSVLNSIPVCALVESNFRDRVGLHFNRDEKVVSLNYETRVSTCSSKIDASNVTDGKIFRSNLYLSFPSEVPKLPSQTEMETEKKEKQESAENEKSFFQKYWYYIAAFGFFLVIQIIGAAAGGGQG
mmetsp:Transcript_417/g.704  ORF Transcript_417/g.704 Transcript_417/m.704 type:complete len:256 (-) Transcript_417:26-793(-)